VCRCQAASQRLAGHAGDGRRPVEGEGRASGGGAQGSTGCTAMAMESWKLMATGDPTFNCS
jgi:hypothetical protein